MSNLKHIDGIILRWGDRHNSQLKPSKGRTSSNNKVSNQNNQKKIKLIKQNLNATAKKKPEVMVKVTGGGRSMGTIRAHFKYITKHDEVQLENEKGEVLQSKEDIEDELKDWEIGGYGIRKTEKIGFITEKNKNGGNHTYHPDDPEAKQQSREAVNLILSMPSGTNPEKVREAARQFAKENFSERHNYVFGLHTDKDHPHVHICIKSRSFIDQKRLNTKKEQLQKWREKFAEKLYEQGIEAAATPRAVRNKLSYQRNFRNKDISNEVMLNKEFKIRTATPEMQLIAAKERKTLTKLIVQLEKSDNLDDKILAKNMLNSDNFQISENEYNYEKRQSRFRTIAIYQSNIVKNRPKNTAKTLDDLRDLSSIDVVSNKVRNKDLFLFKDAHDNVGTKNERPDNELRR